MIKRYFRSVKPHELSNISNLLIVQDDDRFIKWPLSVTEALNIAKDSANIIHNSRRIGIALLIFYADILEKRAAGVEIAGSDMSLALAIETLFIDGRKYTGELNGWKGLVFSSEKGGDHSVTRQPLITRPIIHPAVHPVEPNQPEQTEEHR